MYYIFPNHNQIPARISSSYFLKLWFIRHPTKLPSKTNESRSLLTYILLHFHTLVQTYCFKLSASTKLYGWLSFKKEIFDNYHFLIACQFLSQFLCLTGFFGNSYTDLCYVLTVSNFVIIQTSNMIISLILFKISIMFGLLVLFSDHVSNLLE